MKRNTTRTTTAAQLRATTARLQKAGYSALLPISGNSKNAAAPNDGSWNNIIRTQLTGGEKVSGKKERSQAPLLYFSSGNEQLTGVDNQGTPSLGWIEWGNNNLLPNVIALLTQMLPYTAAASDFNTRLLAGTGPAPMYEFSRYINGTISRSLIPFRDAGLLLEGLIADRKKALKEENESSAESQSAFPAAPLAPVAPSLSSESQDSDDDPELTSLQTALDEWRATAPALQQFIEENNLAQTWLSLSLDQILFGISFPELQLNQLALDANNKPVPTAQWQPKVTGIGHRPCHTTRLERMDDNGRINFVYSSNRWLDKPFLDQGGDATAPITAIPALHPASPLLSLREAVREARMKNVSPAKRPTRFVLPSYFPTAGRPYYPTPSWHSIFGGDIYEYLSTIISDRLTRKRNSSVIGRVIYVHNDYMQQLFVQARCTGDAAKQNEIRDTLYTQINDWLANRNNAGQSLLAFHFTGPDGKEHKSFEIVEIESNSNNTAAANEKETAEIASIIFMAFGLDSKLLGSSPLALVNSSGGTDLRERYLLRAIMMAPVQRIMLNALEVASRFNNWDSHLRWIIPREVMTTLDNSKSGLTEDNK